MFPYPGPWYAPYAGCGAVEPGPVAVGPLPGPLSAPLPALPPVLSPGRLTLLNTSKGGAMSRDTGTPVTTGTSSGRAPRCGPPRSGALGPPKLAGPRGPVP